MAATKQHSPVAETFASRNAFILAAIGSAVGLGNIWRFPYVAYENGGGAFIIPYIVALLCAGIPLLFLDYAIGHRYGGSSPLSLARIMRWMESLGWWQVLVCVIIGIYYAVIVAWALMFMIFSVTKSWGDDANGFFFGEFLNLAPEAGAGFDFVPGVFWPQVLVWGSLLVIMLLGVRKGITRANPDLHAAAGDHVPRHGGAVAVPARRHGRPGRAVHPRLERTRRPERVVGGRGADLLLALGGLRHHDHIRLVPAPQDRPHRLGPRRRLLELELRDPRRRRRVRGAGVHGERGGDGSQRRRRLGHRPRLRGLPDDHLGGAVRGGDRGAVLRLPALRGADLAHLDHRGGHRGRAGQARAAPRPRRAARRDPDGGDLAAAVPDHDRHVHPRRVRRLREPVRHPGGRARDGDRRVVDRATHPGALAPPHGALLVPGAQDLDGVHLRGGAARARRDARQRDRQEHERGLRRLPAGVRRGVRLGHVRAADRRRHPAEPAAVEQPGAAGVRRGAGR
ncbi:Sodium-dependent transporter [Gulosibacter sp. 10]|nr:Sodium-dependent transporter [Gulosibacter sp. 10]